MGIMVLFDIVDQFIHDVQIMVPAVLILLIALPGTQMQLINIQRPVKVQAPGLHPLIIRELVLIQVPDDGGPVGPQFHAKAVGVAVLDPAQFGIDDILVHLADPGLFDCQLPEAVPLRRFHGQFLPVAELADQRYFIRVQGKSAENDPLPVLGRMRAEVIICVKGCAVIKFL